MDTVISVGLIGAGAMGASHARTLVASCPAARLSAVFDLDSSRLAALAPELGQFRPYDDPHQLIKDVDAVIIASPDETHSLFVLEAISHGKAVLCEKPLSSDLEGALRIMEAEERFGRKLVSVGFNRRFDPRHTAVKAVLDEGELGMPLLWKGEHRNAQAMYRTDGPFILNNSAGHDIDSARWLLASNPVEVTCHGICSRPELGAHAQDLLIVNLLLENGSRALAEVYVNATYGYEVTVQVVCQEGTVSATGAELSERRHASGRSAFVSDDFRAYFARSYELELQGWVASLVDGTPFAGADAWDGYMALATTMSAGRSLCEGRTCPVEAIAMPDFYKEG